MPLDSCFSAQHCCRALFILNEPPGLLPSPLLESKRESSAHNKKRTSEPASALIFYLGAWWVRGLSSCSPGKRFAGSCCIWATSSWHRRQPGLRGPWRDRPVLPGASCGQATTQGAGPRTRRARGGRRADVVQAPGVWLFASTSPEAECTEETSGDLASSAAHRSGTLRLLRASLRSFARRTGKVELCHAVHGDTSRIAGVFRVT